MPNQFALPDSTLFDKFIQRAAERKKEIRVFVGKESFDGFVSGLDQEWLQLTTTADQERILFSLLNGVTRVTETGRTIEGSKLAPAKIREILSFTQLVREKAIAMAEEEQDR